MSNTPDQWPVVTTLSDSDTLCVNVGSLQRTIRKDDLEADLSVANGYSIEQITATANYTLASSTANEVWIFIDGSSYDLTLPADSTITVGTKYVVFNSANSAITINVASGATATNVSDGTTNIDANTTNEGYPTGIFYNTAANTWAAAGDLGLPA